jgi:hypothetical protein
MDTLAADACAGSQKASRQWDARRLKRYDWPESTRGGSLQHTFATSEDGRFRKRTRKLLRARRFGYPIPNMARIAICGAIIVVILLVLSAQRYIANKRLANNRPNKDEQVG